MRGWDCESESMRDGARGRGHEKARRKREREKAREGAKVRERDA